MNSQLPTPNSQQRVRLKPDSTYEGTRTIVSAFRRTSLEVGSWKLGVVMAAIAVLAIAAQQPQPPAPAPQQPSAIEVRITGEPGVPPRYAVPDFVALTPSAAEAAKLLGQVLWDDLNFEREFYMIPRDTYKSIPAAPSLDTVPYDRWRELGADGLILGTVQRAANGIRVELRLYDVKARLQGFGREYTGSAANPRVYAHTMADDVHQSQVSLRGIARTKLAFSSDRNRDSEEIMNTQTLIATLEAAPGIIIGLVREVPPQNLKRRPAPNKWSAHEHACHISTGHAEFLSRLELMLSDPFPQIKSMEPSVDEEAGSLLSVDLDEALGRYVRERAQVVKRLKELSPEDWQRTAQHEAFSHYSVYIMFRHMLMHEMLHAYRIDELMLKKDWE